MLQVNVIRSSTPPVQTNKESGIHNNMLTKNKKIVEKDKTAHTENKIKWHIGGYEAQNKLQKGFHIKLFI